MLDLDCKIASAVERLVFASAGRVLRLCSGQATSALTQTPPNLAGETRQGVSRFLVEDNYLGHLGWGDDSGDDVKSVQAEKLRVEASMGRTPHEY